MTRECAPKRSHAAQRSTVFFTIKIAAVVNYLPTIYDINIFSLSLAARTVGDAAGVQVPRDVRLVYGENLLDASAQLPSGG